MNSQNPDRGFSTPFWKEFKLRYPRPAVYVPVGLVYVAFLYHFAFPGSQEPEILATALAASCMLVMSTLPAALAARRFGSRRGRIKLRREIEDLPVAHRNQGLDRWCRAQLLGALTPFAIALLLLLPPYAYFWSVALEKSFFGAIMGLLLWVQVAVAALLASLAGTQPALEPNRPQQRPALVFAVALLLLRCIPLTVFSVLGLPTHNTELVLMTMLVVFDIGICITGAFTLGLRLSTSVAKQLQQPEPEYFSDSEWVADAPEEMGLDISFWALLRWRFWKDPVYRAEQRHLWTKTRLVLVHVSNIALGAIGVFGGVLLTRLMISDYALLFALAIMTRLPLWLAPAVVILGISGERERGTLESMLLTPIAPLRLLAAKLVSRILPLARAALVMAVLLVLLMTYLTFTSREVGPSTIFFVAYVALLWLWLLPVYASTAMLVAVRIRSTLGALAVTYLALALIDLAVWRWFIGSARRMSYGTWDPSSLMRNLLEGPFPIAIATGLLLRAALPLAARSLALRRGQ